MPSTVTLQDPYLIALYDRTKPSVAYRQSIESPVYRLSESMFGSLLASYVVGFIGLIAAQLAGPSLNHVMEEAVKVLLPNIQFASSNPNRMNEVMKILLPSIEYASISVAFAYLTASMYLSYHGGILTMHLPLSRLGFDFFLSLAQPFVFGFSMLFPGCFLVLLGLLLLAVSYRQYKGHRELAKSFYRLICKRQTSIDEETTRIQDSRENTFRKDFADLLKQKKYNALSGWKPVNKWVVILSIICCFVGLVIWYLTSGVLPKDLWLRQGWHLPENWLTAHLLITAQCVVVGCCLIGRGHKILKDRATFLYVRKRALISGEEDMNPMDQQFLELLVALDEKCKQ
jgi:hypothetical protein